MSDELFEALRRAHRGPGYATLDRDDMEATACNAVAYKWPGMTDPDRSTTEVLKRWCYLSEALDYFGMWSEAKRATAPPDVVRQCLNNQLLSGDRNYARTRELLRLFADSVRAHQYRHLDFEGCERELAWALARARELFHMYKCYGTLAQLCFYLGCVKRQTRHLVGAERLFAESVELYSEKATSSDREDVRNTARYKAGVALGAGAWIALSSGQLAHARTCVHSARLLVPREADPINAAYLDLVRAGVMRAGAVDSQDAGLRGARKLAQSAAREFAKWAHPSYEARAHYELARIALRAGQPPVARRALDAMTNAQARIPNRVVDKSWAVHQTTLHSRILLSEGHASDAVTSAMAAEQSAPARAMPQLRLGPLVALGEAHLALNRWKHARDAFQQAVDICRSRPGDQAERRANRQMEGLCHARIAECCGHLRDYRRQDANNARALQLLEGVEEGELQALRRQLRDAANSSRRPFRVGPDTQDLDLDRLVEELRERAAKWAYDQEQARDGSASEPALLKAAGRRLGKSARQTARYLKDFEAAAAKGKR